ncbi:hypothetical protein ACWGNU_06550 [Paenibacillus lautus]
MLRHRERVIGHVPHRSIHIDAGVDPVILIHHLSSGSPACGMSEYSELKKPPIWRLL